MLVMRFTSDTAHHQRTCENQQASIVSVSVNVNGVANSGSPSPCDLPPPPNLLWSQSMLPDKRYYVHPSCDTNGYNIVLR